MSQPANKTATPHVTNFIRNIIEADLAGGTYAARTWGGKPGGASAARRRASRSGENPHALSAGAQRLSALRPRQVDLPQFRPGARLRRRLPHALRRHQSGEGRAGVRRFHHRRGAMAGLRLARIRRRQPLLRQRLLRLHVRGGRIPDRRRPRLRRRAERRRNARQPRHADRTRARTSPWRDRPRDENRSRCSAKCATASTPTARMVLRAKIDMASPNINLRDPAIYRIKQRRRTTAPATSGASTRCTPTRTRSRTRWSASRTRSARSNSRTSARSTTGCSSAWPKAGCWRGRCRSRSNSRASTSPTSCCPSAS